MGRPVSTNNKRKLAAAAHKGKQPAARPKKAGAPAAGKKRGRRRAQDGDVYEADDAPDVFEQNRQRYDKVESYEYEIPSDFEDEEIDEEMAFTAEDKRKWGDWFDEHAAPGSGDEEDGDEEFDDGLEEEPEDEEEEEEEEEEDARPGKRARQAPAGDDDVDSDEEDDEDDVLRQLGSSDDDAEGLDDDEADGEDEEDDERHRAMLRDVAGDEVLAGGAKGQARVRQVVLSEPYPEAEFTLPAGAASTGAGELTLADLMAGLGGEARRKLTPSLRKELERMGGATPSSGAGGKKASKVVEAPLPTAIKQRAERTAGYEIATHEADKWQSIVKANREAPSLQFTAARDEVPRISTTAAIVAQHTPDTAMEAEVAALLEAAGAASAAAVAASEEALAARALTVEEAKERRGRLAKLRSLLFYHEIKAKRLKHIKSKEYHKKQAKAAKRQAGRALLQQGGEEGGEEEDEAAAAERAQREEAEFERAKERLTLKHKNSSRWARRALKRGATVTDAGTRAAVAEQLRLGEQLRRRIEGGGGDDSDGSDGDAGDESSGEEGEEAGAGAPGKGMSARAKAAALEILSGAGGPLAPGEQLPKKGLFALPFMARALERKRIQAVQEAQALLDAADADADGHPPPSAAGAANGHAAAGSGRRRFDGGAAGGGGASDDERAGGGEGDEDDDDVMEDVDAKAERLARQLEAERGAGKQQAAAAARGGQRGAGKAAAAGGARVPTAAEERDLDAALAGRGARGVAATAPSSAGGSAAAAAAAAAGARFIPAKAFAGAKAGMVFTKGPRGLGYYEDAAAAAGAGGAAQGRGKRGKGGAGAAPVTVRVAGMDQPPQQRQQQQQEQQRKGGKEEGQPPAKRRGDADAAGGAEEGDDDDDDDEEGGGGGGRAREGLVPGSAGMDAAAKQRLLVSMAFAGDDVEAEFAADKAAEVAAELPHIEEPSALPGWGAWAEQQRDPKWMRDAKAKAQRERERAAAGRADAPLQFVVLSEKFDRKAMERYTTPQVPFPFDSKETYERSIRQPLGRQYNPDASFRDLVRPAVLKNTGVVIQPLRHTKPLAKHAAEITGKPTKAKVLTVAGGALKQPKKSRKQ